MNFSTLSRLLITITNSIANLIINVRNEGHNIYHKKLNSTFEKKQSLEKKPG